MKMKTIITALLVTFIMASCAPAATPAPTQPIIPTETKTVTPTLLPTLTQAPTAPPRPAATLKVAADLYSGPGNAGFETLAQLPIGAQTFPIGTYVDFVKVETQIGGEKQEGYLPKAAVESLPAGLPELSIQQVPWQPVDIRNNFISAASTFKSNQVTIENTTDGYWDVEGSGFPLDAPFRLTAKMAFQNANHGSVKLLGIPESTKGDYWKGIHRIDVAAVAGKLMLDIRDGTTEGSNQSFPLDLPANQDFTIVSNDSKGKSITILDENMKEVKTVDMTSLPGVHLPDGLFADQKLYLGLSSAPHSTLVVSSILFEKAPSGKLQSENQTLTGLRELAHNNGITIGTEFSIYNMRDIRTWSIMKQDFGVAVLDEFSFTSMWKGRGEYDFTATDNAVDFALQSGFKVRASHLVWGTTEPSSTGIPEWLKIGKFSRQEYIQILEEYVKAVVGRYKGKVTEWSIANEAIQRSYYPGSDFWNDKIGPDYIEMCFRWAREVDPDGILIFNGDNNESPRDTATRQNIDKTYQTVKALKAKGVPIDVVGMQMHLLLPWNSKLPPKKEDVIATMRRFGELGVKIYITEFDINLHDIPGTQTDKWKYQADLYKAMLQACLESGVCTSFATWGISDATSWLTCTTPGCVNIPDADPLMFDKDFNPKPAYFAVRDVLMQNNNQPFPTATPKP